MTTLDRINKAISDIDDLNQKKVALRQTEGALRQTRDNYSRLLADCPIIGGKNCRLSRQDSIDQKDIQIGAILKQIPLIDSSIQALKVELNLLNGQLEVDQDNSTILAQSGTTIDALQAIADAEAEGIIIDAEQDAETDQQIALTNNEVDLENTRQENKQNLVLKDKLKKLLPYFLIIVAILIAIYIYKTRIK